jgi:type IV pilus assembly protein PilA
MSKIRNSKSAFTLVEIMIVVAIIGLLAALAIPGFVKARKQSQGRRIINDARQLDAAIDQWALEKGKKDNDAITTSEAASYLKTGTWQVNDLLGTAYVVGTVGSNQIKVAASTKTALDGVGIDWGNF